MGTWDDTGAAGIAGFLSSNAHDIYPSIDPSKVQLPKPYVVCIVGASRGIGAGIAHAYAHAGASGLVLASRRVSGLEQVAAECTKINPKVRIEIVACDITSDSSVQALASKTKSTFGRLDVCVVNSGYTGPIEAKVTETPAGDFINASNVNYVGTFLTAKYFIPLLLATEGGAKALIAVGTLAAFMVKGMIANPHYNVSKAAQLRLMETIHEEYSSEGLAAYTIHPGGVLTEMVKAAVPEAVHAYCLDSTELAGGFCVWLSKDQSHEWLSGRFASANWDADELDAKKDVVLKKNLLRFTVDV
ncbi:hypothetical protein LTR56_011547 [Elasticomyces elasticus]|nr:hypothetical protein LTR56_011547 [Elasticomyces elasticus]KAK3643276.1 hypothetical protein LTR22_015743 [Elasticomyces elasticus]KAK4930266.1 hypothetical protein LTR49_003300 [Elasticomyces elasticus]KAK5763164.1 hypothetical protein LTS12_006753 [Elasticomyces elasticus]